MVALCRRAGVLVALCRWSVVAGVVNVAAGDEVGEEAACSVVDGQRG